MGRTRAIPIRARCSPRCRRSIPTTAPRKPPIAGDPPNPINPPSGCRFHTRCAFAEAVCGETSPSLFATGNDRHTAACHMVDPASGHSRRRAVRCPGVEACLTLRRNASRRFAAAARVPLPRRRAARIARRRHADGDALCAPRTSRFRSRPSRRASSSCSARMPAGERHRGSMNLKDLAAAIRRRKVSSVEVTKALLARIDAMAADAQRVRARRGGGCAEGREGRGRALAAGKAKGPLHGVPLAHKDMYYSQGQARRMRLEDPQGLDRAGDRDRGRAARSRRRVPARRASTWWSSPTGRPGTTSTPAMSAIRGTRTRITGGSSSGSGAAVAARLRTGGARLRHRRLDPHAGAFLRRQRLQADQRPRQPRQRDAALVHARHRRAAGADAPRTAR